MKKKPGRRLGAWVVLAVPGASLMGTSCLEDVRQSLVAGGLDFVESSATELLEAAFPLDALLPDEGG
jgi:hypothetical protein